MVNHEAYGETTLDNLADRRKAAERSAPMPIVVAVDGPAGSGKSSICAQVAIALGWTYINTGAIYRLVGLLAKRDGVAIDDEGGIAALIDKYVDHVRWDATTTRMYVFDEDVTTRLGDEEVGARASAVACMETVRNLLLPVQRRWSLSADKGAVVDGRDIGTVVFPDADLKIFLTASVEERSRRRLRQLEGASASEANDRLLAIQKEISDRDRQDSERDAAPMKVADDAVVIDTSSINFDETVAKILKLIQMRGLG